MAESNGDVNGEKNGFKWEDKRDKKGQFVKGYGGGPGRPKKELPNPLEPDEFKNIIDQGLRSKDGKERAVWARVMLAYDKQMGTSKDDVIVEPFVGELIWLLSDLAEAYLNKTGISISGLDIIKRMREVCLNCDRLGTEGDCEFEEIEEGDDV
jgi:hypothetical protein